MRVPPIFTAAVSAGAAVLSAGAAADDSPAALVAGASLLAGAALDAGAAADVASSSSPLRPPPHAARIQLAAPAESPSAALRWKNARRPIRRPTYSSTSRSTSLPSLGTDPSLRLRARRTGPCLRTQADPDPLSLP